MVLAYLGDGVSVPLTTSYTRQLNTPPDYYIFVDVDDGNKIKAISGRTRNIFSTHATNADVVIQACLNDLTAGGTIFIGPGTFGLYAVVTNTHSVNVVGSGSQNTILQRQMTTALGSTFQVNSSNVLISGVTFDGNQATAGNNFAELVNNSGTNVIFRDLIVKNFQTRGINNSGPYATLYNCYFGPTTTGTNQGAIFTGATATTIIDSCSIIGVVGGAAITGGITLFRNCYVSGTTVDPALGGGQIGPTSSAVYFGVIGCTIVGNLGAGGAHDTGLEIASPAFHLIAGNRLIGNSGAGIAIDGPVVNGTAVIANNIIKNSGASTGDGIIIEPPHANDMQHLVIEGNAIYDDQTTHTQRYGINFLTASDNYIVRNNIFYGNVSGAIGGNLTATNAIIRDNIGYDPVAASSITTPASGSPYTNTDNGPIIVTITGGTVSQITVGRGATSSGLNITTGEIYLARNDTVTVTYSPTAPTMNKFPM